MKRELVFGEAGWGLPGKGKGKRVDLRGEREGKALTLIALTSTGWPLRLVTPQHRKVGRQGSAALPPSPDGPSLRYKLCPSAALHSTT